MLRSCFPRTRGPLLYLGVQEQIVINYTADTAGLFECLLVHHLRGWLERFDALFVISTSPQVLQLLFSLNTSALSHCPTIALDEAYSRSSMQNTVAKSLYYQY